MDVFYLGPYSYEQPETSMPSKEYEKRLRIEREKQGSVHKPTAKEMFEELKLRLKEAPFEDWILYADEAHPFGVQIIFDLTNKHVTANVNVSVKLHNAIGKQMEELGWLEE